MQGNVMAAFVIYLLCLFTVAYARISPTCSSLEHLITSREKQIESLKSLLEEYKLASNQAEDQSSDVCNEYLSCSKCLRGSSNSSCGWCFLRNRCSLQEHCPNSDSNSDLWVSRSDKCPKIWAVKPHHIAVHTASILEISVQNLPDYYGLFLCSFEVLGKTLFTKGEKSKEGIECPSPPIETLPKIPTWSVDLPVEISVRIPGVSIFASTTNFTIYECERYTSCSECASSPYSCAWCVGFNGCTDNLDENCRNDIIVFSKSVTRPTLREGPGFCPRILPPTGSGNEIFIPGGNKKKLVVRVENIVNIQVVSTFIFQVYGIRQVTGQLLGNTIYSDEMTFTGLGKNPVSNLSLNVYWGNGQGKLDNVENIHVIVYHCELLASSCGECSDLPERYACGWCEETNKCTLRDKCDEEWLDSRQICTKPKIISFNPKSGLSTQKTNITINGINFGKEFRDIYRVRLINEVKGLNIECTPLEQFFVKHAKIVCQLDIPDIEATDIALNGHFEVKVSNSFVTVSKEEYIFVNPNITGFEPVKGVKSGGTFMKIQGNNLDAGSRVEVYVGDLPCNITSRNFSTIHCTTAPSPRTRSSAIKIIFDSEERISSALFFYVEDPYIHDVSSKTGTSYPIGTVSGGNLISVRGENFDHVPNAYIYITIDDVEYPGECIVESDKHMQCSSPRLPQNLLNFCSVRSFAEFDYGFRMGDVQDTRNISSNEKFSKFRIYPDPFFMAFQEAGKIKTFNSGHLLINGVYLDSAFIETDITVEIGSGNCPLIALSASQLVCKPPVLQPKTKNGDSTTTRLPEVVVKVEGRYEFFIGYLRYNKTLEEE